MNELISLWMWGIKTASNLSPLDGFSSSFGFFFGVSFWMEDDLWLQREDSQTYEHRAGGAGKEEEKPREW